MTVRLPDKEAQLTRRCSTGMSFMAARAPLKRRVSGSGYTWGKGISAKALLTSSGGPYGFCGIPVKNARRMLCKAL
eukprot:1160038-Pelagomonas_calceolata.AAC.4